MYSVALIPNTRPLVLADALPGSRVRDVLLVIAGAGLTGAAAQLAVTTPFTPVPFTLQTLSVLLVGASLGPARGLASMLAYLTARAVGVPWFAGHSSGWGSPAAGAFGCREGSLSSSRGGGLMRSP